MSLQLHLKTGELELEKCQLLDSKKFMQDLVTLKMCFKSYIDLVFKTNQHEFHKTEDIMHRSQALFETRYNTF